MGDVTTVNTYEKYFFTNTPIKHLDVDQISTSQNKQTGFQFQNLGGSPPYSPQLSAYANGNTPVPISEFVRINGVTQIQ